MRYYIGIDLGTSSLKLLLVDNEGSIVNEVTKEYGVQYPKPNWSEQNPEDWWKALVAGLQQLAAYAEEKGSVETPLSGRQEQLLGVIHQIFFK